MDYSSLVRKAASINAYSDHVLKIVSLSVA